MGQLHTVFIFSLIEFSLVSISIAIHQKSIDSLSDFILKSSNLYKYTCTAFCKRKKKKKEMYESAPHVGYFHTGYEADSYM